MTKSVSYYKQYAKKCFIEGRTNTREAGVEGFRNFKAILQRHKSLS